MDFTKVMDQLNKRNAETGETRTKLMDILQLCTKDQLSTLAAEWDLAGRSKLNKQELASRLFDHITHTYFIKDALLGAEPLEWELFQRLLRTNRVWAADLGPGHLSNLGNKGFIISFMDIGHRGYVLPVEIKESYQRLDKKSFLKTRDRYQLVLRYMLAVTNLYGACKTEKLIGIFNAQNKEPLTESELLQIYSYYSDKVYLFYLKRGYLRSEYFDSSNQDEFEELLERTENKPWYIPDQEELLNYSDPLYYEITPQLISLKTFILNNLCRDKEMADDLVSEIHLMFSMEEPLEAIMGEFERRKIRIKNKEQLSALVPLLIDVHNHTRLWSNRGHTPVELRGSVSHTTPVPGLSKPSNVVYMTQHVASNKVGRNDPCPCGSGKKHKKCCGSHA